MEKFPPPMPVETIFGKRVTIDVEYQKRKKTKDRKLGRLSALGGGGYLQGERERLCWESKKGLYKRATKGFWKRGGARKKNGVRKRGEKSSVTGEDLLWEKGDGYAHWETLVTVEKRGFAEGEGMSFARPGGSGSNERRTQTGKKVEPRRGREEGLTPPLDHKSPIPEEGNHQERNHSEKALQERMPSTETFTGGKPRQEEPCWELAKGLCGGKKCPPQYLGGRKTGNSFGGPTKKKREIQVL